MSRLQANFEDITCQITHLMDYLSGTEVEVEYDTLVQGFFIWLYLSGFLPEESFEPDGMYTLRYQDFLNMARGEQKVDSGNLPFRAGVLYGQASKTYQRLKDNDMRTDESGNPCPSTLGEYRDMCHALLGETRATDLLDKHISKSSRNEKVLLPDSQMRAILLPLLLDPSQNESHASEPSLEQIRKEVYLKVCDLASGYAVRGYPVMVDITFDPDKGQDDWTIVLAVTYQGQDATFLIRASPEESYTHLSETLGEAVDLEGYDGLVEYLEDFFS